MQKFRPVWLQEEKKLKMAGDSNKNAIWALLVFLSIYISEVHFLWESVDWARNECSLAALTAVRIKRVESRENVRVSFPRDKANCL